MKIKKYIVQSMPEAMEKIRADLGSDAVILNTKEIKQNRFLSLFKKRKIEVIAVLDPEPNVSKRFKTKSPQAEPIINGEKKIISHNGNTDVLTEIKHMKKLIEQQSISSNNEFLPKYQLVFTYLLNQEIHKGLAFSLITNIIKQHEADKIKATDEQIVSDVQLELQKRLTNLPFTGITSKSKIIHFIGPTGVGKTTTLAKIAANSLLNDKKRVAFITTDTYRIAAIDQLKTYAKILDIPIEVAYTVEDYQRAVQRFSTYDLILVDTAGRNFREEKYVKQLKANINMDFNVDVYLVLSLTSKAKDTIDIFNQFNNLSLKQVIFTKIDETRQYGSMVNIALLNKVGIAYLTNGQDVPEDLVYPTPEKISNYILGGYYDT